MLGVAGFATAALAQAPSAVGSAATRANPPIGWIDFCRRNKADCQPGSDASQTVTLTPQVWRLLKSVNDKINRAIDPVTDAEHWGVAESWDYPTDGKGDCEDYALLKRKLLIAAGLPRQALLMTVVSDRKGEGHAVLTVTTDQGDFVLDNQITEVVAWSDTGYRFVKRQSGGPPSDWVWLGFASGETPTAAK
jgi:predicted transglutaminase-like cysteine proteinase